eukprot:7390518-Prymnesium_polylepis.1
MQIRRRLALQSRALVRPTTAVSPTRPWRRAPPQVSLALGGGVAPGYDKAVDLWSLGCLTFTLLGGATPFDPDGHDDNVTIRERARSAPLRPVAPLGGLADSRWRAASHRHRARAGSA